MKYNIVGWFEIPVVDMERAMEFYETVLGVKFNRQPMGPLDMAFFPMEEGLGASGALVYHPESSTPSTNGVLIYFTALSEDLTHELGKVEAAGGKVLQEKTLITEEFGYYGLFLDTEGNRLGIHSHK